MQLAAYEYRDSTAIWRIHVYPDYKVRVGISTNNQHGSKLTDEWPILYRSDVPSLSDGEWQASPGAGWVRIDPNPMHLHISGRRWFRRGPGNTYTSCYIYQNGECVAKLGPTGGYGDYYLQMAVEWLRQHGYPAAEYGTRYLREELGASYSVVDVARERDL